MQKKRTFDQITGGLPKNRPDEKQGNSKKTPAPISEEDQILKKLKIVDNEAFEDLIDCIDQRKLSEVQKNSLRDEANRWFKNNSLAAKKEGLIEWENFCVGHFDMIGDESPEKRILILKEWVSFVEKIWPKYLQIGLDSVCGALKLTPVRL